MRRVLILLVLVFALGACGQYPWQDSLRDLEDATVKDAVVTVFNNIDKHPNIAQVCVDGIAFVTTTRIDGNDSIDRVPEWDSRCANVTNPEARK